MWVGKGLITESGYENKFRRPSKCSLNSESALRQFSTNLGKRFVPGGIVRVFLPTSDEKHPTSLPVSPEVLFHWKVDPELHTHHLTPS